MNAPLKHAPTHTVAVSNRLQLEFMCIRWTSGNLAFATDEEAEAAGRRMYETQSEVTDWRVVRRAEPVTHVWHFGLECPLLVEDL